MGKMVQNCPGCGLEWASIISFSKIADFGLLISKSDTNNIWTSIENTYFFKVVGVWLKNEACHAQLMFKIKMGMAGSIFELHPYNFRKYHSF